MLNQITIIGNLVRTPELRSTPGGAQVTDFSVALNHKYTNAAGNKIEEVSFVDVSAWGKQAEAICRYKKQGDLLLVQGRLKQDRWTDKQSGSKRSKLAIVAERVTFLPSGAKKDSNSTSGGNRQSGGNGGGGYDDYATSLPDTGEEPPF